MNDIVKIGNNIMIPCPERGFKLRRVQVCFDCEYYKGHQTQGDTGLQILCGRPIIRSVVETAED